MERISRGRLNRALLGPVSDEEFAEEWLYMEAVLGRQMAIQRLSQAFLITKSSVKQRVHYFEKGEPCNDVYGTSV